MSGSLAWSSLIIWSSCPAHKEALVILITQQHYFRLAAMRSTREENCKTKHHWTIEIFVKHTWKSLKKFMKLPWNLLETTLNFFHISLKLPWITIEGIWEHPSIFVETSLKHPWKILETPLKLFSNTHWTSCKHAWIQLKTPLKHPSIFLEAPLKLSWETWDPEAFFG